MTAIDFPYYFLCILKDRKKKSKESKLNYTTDIYVVINYFVIYYERLLPKR